MATYKAKQMQAPEGAQVLGMAMMGWFDNLGMDVIEPILNKYHLTAEDIKPDGWYTFSVFDDIYKAVHRSPGGSSALVAVGKASAQQLVSLETTRTAENWLENILPDDHRSFTRNVPDEYGFIIEKTGQQHYTFTNNTGIPNDLIFGYLWEGMRILTPKDQRFRVTPLSGYGKDSDEGAVFEISWS